MKEFSNSSRTTIKFNVGFRNGYRISGIDFRSSSSDRKIKSLITGQKTTFAPREMIFIRRIPVIFVDLGMLPARWKNPNPNSRHKSTIRR
jgi:hypothetical protein